MESTQTELNYNSLYHNCGQFVIEFEHLVLSMKICIFSIMTKKGLSEPEYLRVLLNDQTALPLKTKLQTLISIYFNEKPERIKILEKLFTYTNIIIERRNEIVHGSIFYISETKALLFKDKTNKNGLNPIEQNVDSELFYKQTEKIIKAKKLFEILNSYLNMDDAIFEDFFTKEKLEEINLNSK